MDYANILTEAHAAASAAQEGMVENLNAFDCGFAWVTIDGTSPLARYCRKQDEMRSIYGSKGYPRGWTFWCPGGAPVQAVGIHEAGAKAFALKLAEYDIRADWSSRLD